MEINDCLHNYLNVSRIMVKRTNLPNKGTTSDVGGIISASKRKNTVNDSNILMERETCLEKNNPELVNFNNQLQPILDFRCLILVRAVHILEILTSSVFLRSQKSVLSVQLFCQKSRWTPNSSISDQKTTPDFSCFTGQNSVHILEILRSSVLVGKYWILQECEYNS